MEKIVPLEELERIIASYKKDGKKVTLCHGCFDLVHPGHVRHFKEAKRQGDVLVVTVTPDRFIAKGPGRPLFPEQLRLEQLAALEVIDHVALNHWPTAIEMLEMLKPNIYIKGSEYEDHSKDITGNIKREVDAVEKHGGRVYYTHDIVFSSTKLINQSFQLLPAETQSFLEKLRREYSADDIEALIHQLSKLKILVFGDTIIDEYCYCWPMGRVEKAPIISVKFMNEERYPGGILAVANHIVEFAASVKLVTLVGDLDQHRDFAINHLNKKIKSELIVRKGSHTVTKRRFLTPRDGQKLFEVGWITNESIDSKLESEIIGVLEKELHDIDLVVLADFGHGLVTSRIIEFLESHHIPLAVNAQTNSTNFGYNYITRYHKVDYLSIDENEIRLPFQKRIGNIEPLIQELINKIDAPHVNVTLGHTGSIYYSDGVMHRAPALATRIVDTVGAGDAVFSVTSLAWKAGLPSELLPFIGNSVGALAVEIVGNKEPVRKSALIRFIRGLLS